MKTSLLMIVLASVLAASGACSRVKEPSDNVVQSSPSLRSDAERVQDAVAKVAAERERAERLKQSPSPSVAQP